MAPSQVSLEAIQDLVFLLVEDDGRYVISTIPSITSELDQSAINEWYNAHIAMMISLFPDWNERSDDEAPLQNMYSDGNTPWQSFENFEAVRSIRAQRGRKVANMVHEKEFEQFDSMNAESHPHTVTRPLFTPVPENIRAMVLDALALALASAPVDVVGGDAEENPNDVVITKNSGGQSSEGKAANDNSGGDYQDDFYKSKTPVQTMAFNAILKYFDPEALAEYRAFDETGLVAQIAAGPLYAYCKGEVDPLLRDLIPPDVRVIDPKGIESAPYDAKTIRKAYIILEEAGFDFGRWFQGEKAMRYFDPIDLEFRAVVKSVRNKLKENASADAELRAVVKSGHNELKERASAATITGDDIALAKDEAELEAYRLQQVFSVKKGWLMWKYLRDILFYFNCSD
ncbi:hypothetical protein F0562_034605 [Nyssa sinensis]|uniref:Uncharacterized protein n=1 Tax=Nyssa sinensis TaxID=561372 RepID=A0A5J5AB72_9ASTE|nr:hypothetical protein F0562_034605 [Nyssa sinensis]